MSKHFFTKLYDESGGATVEETIDSLNQLNVAKVNEDQNNVLNKPVTKFGSTSGLQTKFFSGANNHETLNSINARWI